MMNYKECQPNQVRMSGACEPQRELISNRVVDYAERINNRLYSLIRTLSERLDPVMNIGGNNAIGCNSLNTPENYPTFFAALNERFGKMNSALDELDEIINRLEI